MKHDLVKLAFVKIALAAAWRTQRRAAREEVQAHGQVNKQTRNTRYKTQDDDRRNRAKWSPVAVTPLKYCVQ